MASDFPTTAIGPDGQLRSVLVTPTGALVTDRAPLPPVVVPLAQSAVRVNEQGSVLV